MKAFLTEAEASELLKVAPETLAGWRRAGHGPAYSQFNRIIRYSEDDVLKFFNEHQKQTPGDDTKTGIGMAAIANDLPSPDPDIEPLG
jgi:hypothetical protein